MDPSDFKQMLEEYLVSLVEAHVNELLPQVAKAIPGAIGAFATFVVSQPAVQQAIDAGLTRGIAWLIEVAAVGEHELVALVKAEVQRLLAPHPTAAAAVLRWGQGQI